MSITLTRTMDTAKDTMGSAGERALHAADAVRQTLDSARHGAEHAASSARSTLWDKARTITEMATALRSLGADDALGWLGLSRRRGTFASLGLFGAGLAVGVGAGFLFAPAAGTETRRRIFASLGGLKGEAKVVLDGAETETKEMETKAKEKAEALVDRAKGAATEAVSKATAPAGDGFDAAKQKHPASTHPTNRVPS